MMLCKLYEIILDRKSSPQPGSYTRALLEAGSNRVAQKVGEEAVEVIVASLGESRQRLVEETADLLYHLWVLLALHDIPLSDVEKELTNRHQRREER